jgi:uncharacterized protein (DUF885 family)
VDDVDAVTLDALRERLGLHLEIHDSGWDRAELNNIDSAAQNIRSIFDLMPTDTEEHWANIAGRTHSVPAAISGYIESLRAARDSGKVSARRQVSIVIEQTTKYAAADGFFAKLAADAKQRTGRCRRNCRRSSTPVLPLPGRRTPAWPPSLKEELLPVAPEKDAVGRERYAPGLAGVPWCRRRP